MHPLRQNQELVSGCFLLCIDFCGTVYTALEFLSAKERQITNKSIQSQSSFVIFNVTISKNLVIPENFKMAINCNIKRVKWVGK